MEVLLSILIFSLVLSLLVVIHELGHLLTALWTKISVDEFGFGYPPLAKKLFSWRKIDFTFNWVPFGGFVRMTGEDNPDSTAQPTQLNSRTYEQAPAWARFATIMAGPLVNIVFGVLAFIIVFSILGIPTPLDSARIAAVLPDSPAAEANLPTDVNIILVVAGDEQRVVTNNQEASDAIKAFAGQTVTLITTGRCEGTRCQEAALSFEVYVRTQEELTASNQQGAVGVVFASQTFVQYPWYQMPWQATITGIQEAWLLTLEILRVLGQLVSRLVGRGELPDQIVGPVGIVHQASESGFLSQGPLALLHFAGLLSINLGVFNLLPIPALDGGRVVFIGLEKLLGKKRLSRFEPHLHYGGFVLLLGLILLVTARDIWRIFF